MKKLITILLFFLLITPAFSLAQEASAKATVFNPVTGQRKVVSTNDPRAFDGGFYLELAYKNNLLGYSVITDYNTTLSASINSTQSTVPVSSMRTKDGHTITMGDLGTKVFLSIEPGASKSEIVMCTGISSSIWTGCTRGLAFYGSSTIAVAANKQAHGSGSKLIMSNTQYTYQQFASLEDSNTFTGGNDFINLPTSTTTLPTTNSQLSTKLYVDTVGAGGFTSANASTTRGVSVDGSAPERIGVNASSTGGLEFATGGALQIKASSTGGIKTDANGVAINTAQGLTYTGNNTFSGTGVFNATSTFNGSVYFGATSTSSLINGATTTLHSHNMTMGTFTKNFTTLATTTITHGLGVTPRIFKTYCYYVLQTSDGTFTASTSVNRFLGDTPDANFFSSNSYQFYYPWDTSQGYYAYGYVLSNNSTNTQIAWGRTYTAFTGTVTCLWEAYQ